jgi:hypothetical protein
MGEGFIVRKGGETVERTATPNINIVSVSYTSIVVTFKNNDTTQADVFYGLTSPLTSKVTLATGTTSSNITFSGLQNGTQYTISAYAIVTDILLKKIKSEIVSTEVTTTPILYSAATGGTTLEYDSGGKRFKSHTFTSNGTFEVTAVGDNFDNRNKLDYLIIAGGGSGGVSRGGGGAGGYRTTIAPGHNNVVNAKVTANIQPYDIIIGAGGVDANGANSSAFGITSTGGGRGGNSDQNGFSGGAGGGAGTTSQGRTGGSGINGQGGKGGDTPAANTGGGGGGAGGNGGNSFWNQSAGSRGGGGAAGLNNVLRTGTNEIRGGGGAGFGANGAGAAGAGGGGTVSANGVANTGGGGGGNNRQGGSGIVVIRYEIAPSV